MRKAPIDSRELARQVLKRVRRDAAYSNLALDGALQRASHLSPNDRGLATELVYGVLRHRGRLDYQLASYLRDPLADLDPDVLDLLRLGAYQLLMLDRVPDYAAVDAAVRAGKALRSDRVAGFVNAVLRRLAREGAGRELPEQPTERLAVEGSLPLALAERLVQELGLKEARAFAQSQLKRPQLLIRVNRSRATVEEVRRRLEGKELR